jgi:hypothetical protein
MSVSSFGLTVSGTINADGGTIAGFSITSTQFSKKEYSGDIAYTPGLGWLPTNGSSSVWTEKQVKLSPSEGFSTSSLTKTAIGTAIHNEVVIKEGVITFTRKNAVTSAFGISTPIIIVQSPGGTKQYGVYIESDSDGKVSLYAKAT